MSVLICKGGGVVFFPGSVFAEMIEISHWSRGKRLERERSRDNWENNSNTKL